MARLRFGIVGTGGIANAHATALAALGDDAELVACCDAAPERAAAFSERWGVQHAFDSARTMLDQVPLDVVCVCTPHPLHAEALVLAAEHGVHGVVEKPMAASLEDADRIVEAATKHGTVVSTMAQRRWFPAAQRVKTALERGLLGARPPILGESYCELWRDEAYYRRDSWRGRWDTEGGGVLMNQAPHNIDFLLWLMGPAEEIFGYWSNVNHPYVEIEDNAVAVIRFRSGGLGILKGSVSMNPERRMHGVSLVGDSGATVSLEAWQVPRERQRGPGPWDVGTNDVWTLDPTILAPVDLDTAIAYGAGDLPNYHAHQLRDVIHAIRDGRPPDVSAEDGRRVVAIIQGVYESGRSGRPVKLSD